MKEQVILITGGTGSFGQAMTKELLKKDVKQIRIFSRDELKQSQMKDIINDPRVEYLCGDIRDAERLSLAMEGVDTVIHAAAMKRIEKCQKDPQEAIKTNVSGSVNVANACLKNNVKNAILISTDKACYPINLYGATKLVAEQIWIQSNVYRGSNHPTKFSVVRYGNVIGSRGSVVHLFKGNGPLKVTNTEMTRFFITLQAAVDLVQLTIEFHQGGEIFVPNLKAASIYQLAKILAGNRPIEITSQRGSEKIHESLITQEEKDRLVSFENYSVINPEFPSWPYRSWRSELRKFNQTSLDAEQYTDKELTDLLAGI